MNRVYRTWSDWVHLVFSFCGMCRFYWLYRKVRIIAVTGTDGKSSTVILTARLLKRAGYKVSYYSSVECSDGDNTWVNTKKMTTPGRGKLQEFLGKAGLNNCDFAVIEITSEGIKQWRHFGVIFDGVAITNIYPEHIQRHKNFENYKNTKLSIISNIKAGGFVCLPEVRDFYIPEVFEQVVNVVNVSENNESTAEGNPFILGNLLISQSIVTSLGVQLVNLSETDMVIPGRFEIVHTNPLVIIDYAHTVTALEKCLMAVRRISEGRVIHVFGAAGGGRDVSKRPMLAKISELYSDIHIVTEENPFDEDPKIITDNILSGFISLDSVFVIEKREDAVKFALKQALPNDTVILTAKGSETVIAGPNHCHRLYNEREFVAQCLS